MKGEPPPLAKDIGDAIARRTLDQVVEQAQAISRKLVAGHAGASVDDFLADRAHEADDTSCASERLVSR
jgi:hypothetical protein